MGLRSWVKRLEREAQSEGVVLRLRDGGVRVFEDMEVFSELFLTQTDLFRGKARRHSGEPGRLRSEIQADRDGGPYHRARATGRLGR